VESRPTLAGHCRGHRAGGIFVIGWQAEDGEPLIRQVLLCTSGIVVCHAYKLRMDLVRKNNQAMAARAASILPFHPAKTAADRAQWTRIGVLESRWARRSSLSIRPFFEMISAAYGYGPDGYEYEMISSPAGLEEAAVRLSHHEKLRILYLGCHGDHSGALVMHGGETLSPRALAQLLSRCGPSLRGIYLGACFAGRRRVAREIFAHCPRLQWVAGYANSIDFLDSSALDILFFNRWLESKLMGLARLRETVDRLKPVVSGLLKKNEGGLGFRVFVRSPSGAIDLLRA